MVTGFFLEIAKKKENINLIFSLKKIINKILVKELKNKVKENFHDSSVLFQF